MIRVSLATVIAIVTMYGPRFEGEPLYCNCKTERFGCNMRFDHEVGVPWIAVDLELREGWQCGDLVMIEYPDPVGWQHYYILDAGPLGKYWVEPWKEEGIGADVSMYYWPYLDEEWISTPFLVRIVNRSFIRREFEKMTWR